MSAFRWYRRWKGGIWFRVRMRLDHDIILMWSRNPAPEGSFVCKTVAIEDYAMLRPSLAARNPQS